MADQSPEGGTTAILETRRWGRPSATAIVCIHGVAQHGGVFRDLGERLAAAGRSVLAVDLRGHGESKREPPWDIETHRNDLLRTLDALQIERATLIGHSFGGLVATAFAASSKERAEALALLDPGMEVPAAYALQSAEIERLDWSFATVEGATNALLSNTSIVAAPRDVVEAYVRDDVRKGPDGRFRFRFSPSAVVVAWSEMTLPAPPVAGIPTLAVFSKTSPVDRAAFERRYAEALGDRFSAVAVPNGHNVLWESPAETFGAIEGFLARLGGSAE
jgi:lipase